MSILYMHICSMTTPTDYIMNSDLANYKQEGKKKKVPKSILQMDQRCVAGCSVSR